MIVITAPTGDIGHQVLQEVLEGDEPIRVIVRDANRLPAETRKLVDVVEGSHRDADVVTKAFAGADTVFWLVPPNPVAAGVLDYYLDFPRAACEAFKSQGVQRVVGISALGRGSVLAGNAGYVTASLAMDDMIAATGVSYRPLLLPSFMENLLRQVGAIKNQGVMYGTITADLKAPTCSTRDIAAVAAALLLDHDWSGAEGVPLLGPEDISFDDRARIMSEVLEFPVRYQQIPIDAFRANLTGGGMSDAMAQGMIDMAVAKDQGLDNAEPRTPQATTPTTFRQWCEEVLKPAVTV